MEQHHFKSCKVHRLYSHSLTFFFTWLFFLGTQVVYLDNGFCKYGQLFDPSTGRCRDIYCQELNYRFNGTTCVPDENRTVTDAYKPLSDIDLLLPLTITPSSHHERTNFSKHFNSQMNETCLADWNQMFNKTLRGKSIAIQMSKITSSMIDRLVIPLMFSLSRLSQYRSRSNQEDQSLSCPK